MNNYKLSIITPHGKIFDGEVESLVAPGTEGSFGVLFNHAPMITTLKPGLIEIKKNNSTQKFSISEGILEVEKNSQVLILANQANEVT